jgi:predicted GNAT family acetyltransferase
MAGVLYPEPEQGILNRRATVNPLLARQVAAQRAAYPRQQLNTPQQALDLGAGLLGVVPGVGDAMGLAADLNRYKDDPSSRTWGNFGLTGLGLLPFVPGMTGIAKGGKAPVKELLKQRHPNVRIFVSEGLSDPYSRNVWRLDDLVVPKEMRGQGVGTKVMADLTIEADKAGAVIKLSPASPSDNLGTASRGKLVEFYKRFGFVENKGRNADPSIRESMYRLPQKAK